MLNWIFTHLSLAFTAVAGILVIVSPYVAGEEPAPNGGEGQARRRRRSLFLGTSAGILAIAAAYAADYEQDQAAAGARELSRVNRLRALDHEMYMDLGVMRALKEITPQTPAHVLPRFFNSTVAAVVASGEFSDGKDQRLWDLMHSWMEYSADVNARLQETETYTISHPESAPGFYQQLAKAHVIENAQATLDDLAKECFENYAAETGINRDTVLFPTNQPPATQPSQAPKASN